MEWDITSLRAVALPFGEYQRLPDEPGIYLVFCDTPLKVLNWSPSPTPCYVGKAEDSVRRRFAKEHLADTGRSTLRRSYGSLLKEELELVAMPRPGKEAPKPINFTNYTFARASDGRLTDWMGTHLTVAARTATQPRDLEQEAISALGPPLNLTGWDNPWAPEIKALRKVCADEARRAGQ